MLLRDIANHADGLLQSTPSIDNDDKRILEDIIFFTSSAFIDRGDDSENLEANFEIISILFECLVNSVLPRLDKSLNQDFLEYTLKLCQKATTLADKTSSFWMSYNSVAQFWKLYCVLFQTFSSDIWIEPISKMYESRYSEEENFLDIRPLVAIMYANTQMDAYSALLLKSQGKQNATASQNLKNAEDSLKLLTNSKEDTLDSSILLVPAWIKLQQLKSNSSGILPFEFEDPLLKILSNFEVMSKDTWKGNTSLLELLETNYLNLKSFSSIPALFKTRIYMRLAKMGSSASEEMVLGLYSKIFKILDQIEFDIYSPADLSNWATLARIEAIYQYQNDIVSHWCIGEPKILQQIVDTFREQCFNNRVTVPVFKSTLRFVWAYCTQFITTDTTGMVLDIMTKFLIRTCKYYSANQAFKENILAETSSLDNKILADLFLVCSKLYCNQDKKKYAIQLLELADEIAPSDGLMKFKLQIIPDISDISDDQVLGWESLAKRALHLPKGEKRDYYYYAALDGLGEAVITNESLRWAYLIGYLRNGYNPLLLSKVLHENVSVDTSTNQLRLVLLYQLKKFQNESMYCFFCH